MVTGISPRTEKMAVGSLAGRDVGRIMVSFMVVGGTESIEGFEPSFPAYHARSYLLDEMRYTHYSATLSFIRSREMKSTLNVPVAAEPVVMVTTPVAATRDTPN